MEKSFVTIQFSQVAKFFRKYFSFQVGRSDVSRVSFMITTFVAHRAIEMMRYYDANGSQSTYITYVIPVPYLGANA